MSIRKVVKETSSLATAPKPIISRKGRAISKRSPPIPSTIFLSIPFSTTDEPSLLSTRVADIPCKLQSESHSDTVRKVGQSESHSDTVRKVGQPVFLPTYMTNRSLATLQVDTIKLVETVDNLRKESVICTSSIFYVPLTEAIPPTSWGSGVTSLASTAPRSSTGAWPCTEPGGGGVTWWQWRVCRSTGLAWH